MPPDQLHALVEEYYRDVPTAKLQATILNASGNYSKTYVAEDFLATEPKEAPTNPQARVALRDALKLLGKKKHGAK